MRQCPTCGSEVSEQATFCPDCGTDLKTSAPSPSADPAGSAAVSAGGVPAASVPSVASATGEVGSQASAPAEATSTAMESTPATAGSAAEAVTPQPAVTDVSASTSNGTGAGASQEAAEAPAPTGARLTLKRSGAPTNEVFPVGGHVTIGRFDVETGPVDVDLGNLPEATYISRQHAELWQDDSGAWKLKDLGSRNGVFVRHKGTGPFERVTDEDELEDGDELALGNARFEFHTE